MATIAVAPLGTFVNETKQKIDAATMREIDVLARALCAISSHSNVMDAMMSFHGNLKDEDALLRSALVIERMSKLLPADLANPSQAAYNYKKPWMEDGQEMETEKSPLQKFAIPACFVFGTLMTVMSAVGAVTAFHYFVR